MNKIAITIQEVEETIAILEVQKGDASFEEAGGLMQIESEKIKLQALREKLERDKLMQWLDDMNNTLEPIKIESALRSEMLKLEYRKENSPKDISVLDYTILAALHEALKRRLEESE